MDKKALTDIEITEIREIFSLFDKDSDGQVATAHLGTMLWGLGYNPTEAEIIEQMNNIDKNQIGSFDQNSFISLVARLDIPKDTLDDIIEAMKVITEGKPKFSVGDFKYKLQELGEPMDGNVIDDIIKDLDAEYEQKIYPEEFAKLIYNK